MEASSFGLWLKQRRKALGLTQSDLADRIGCATVTVKKLENDQRRPSPLIAERIVAALGIPPGQRPALLAWARAAGDAVDLLAVPAIPAPPRPAMALGPLPPQPLAPLLGRDDDLVTIQALLAAPEVRLLTLLGPPGVGKTRLALRLAHLLRPSYPDGVCFVRLDTISDPALAPLTLARALGLEPAPGLSPADQIAGALAGCALLLVLDNFEHVLPAADMLVGLLGAAPGVKILATSQEVLHLSGEQVFRVAPLALPAPGAPCEAAAQAPAVALFLARARAAKHDFALTPSGARAVVALCECLDGLPLAIELAAAQSALYRPEVLLEQIGGSLQRLGHGPRDLPARHQTLRAAIAWSYNLLAPAEQRVFRRLGVFAGGWDLLAAAALALVDGPDAAPPSEADAAEAMLGLVNKSLVLPDAGGGARPRFSMLQTVRAFAIEQQEVAGEREELLRRHALHMLALAERAAAQLGGAEQQRWLTLLEDEHSNLRAALRWSLDRGEAALALRLVSALWTFWRQRSYQPEGRAWLDAALALAGGEPPALRAPALMGAGWIAYDLSEQDVAVARFTDALEVFRAGGDPRGAAQALHGLGELDQLRGDYAAAERAFAESLAMLRERDDTEEIAWTLDHLGRLAIYRGDYARATELLREGLALFRAVGQRWGTAYTLVNLGIATLSQADLSAARSWFEQSRQLQQVIGDQKGVAISLYHLGDAAYYGDDDAHAGALYAESLALSREFRFPWCEAMALEGLGRVATRAGDDAGAALHFGACLELLQHQHAPPGRIAAALEAAVALLGRADPQDALRLAAGVDALRARLGMPQSAPERAAHAATLAGLRDALGPEQAALAWQRGGRLTLEQAVEIAQAALEQSVEVGG